VKVKNLSAWFVVLIGLVSLLGASCKKEQAAPADPLQASFQKLRAELISASPQVQSNMYNRVDYSLRYENYVDALMYLDAIANDPSLNEKQKKAANETIELLKVKAGAAAGAAPKPQ
jgi:hypothetical protein